MSQPASCVGRTREWDGNNRIWESLYSNTRGCYFITLLKSLAWTTLLVSTHRGGCCWLGHLSHASLIEWSKKYAVNAIVHSFQFVQENSWWWNIPSFRPPSLPNLFCLICQEPRFNPWHVQLRVHSWMLMWKTVAWDTGETLLVIVIGDGPMLC